MNWSIWLSLVPFIVLLVPYLVLLLVKSIKISRQTHTAMAITFVGLLIGVFLVYQEYLQGKGMRAIIFFLWPLFALAGGLPLYFISWFIAKLLFKKSD